MFARTSTLFDAEVHVSSGRVGHVSDFLISADLHMLRYLMVAVGADRTAATAFVPVSAAADPVPSQHRLSLGLRGEEVGHLTGIDLLDEPSREQEQALHDLIHWRPYWTEEPDAAGPDLHALKQARGMQVECSDGPAGTVDDFITNTANWSVPMLDLKCARHLDRERCLVPTASIESLDWSRHIARLAAPRSQVLDTPAHTGHSAPEIEAILSHYSTQQ